MVINIQFLRAVAALLVVVFHIVPHYLNSGPVLNTVMSFFQQFGFAGVDVFFVISGYVIWISSHRNHNNKSPLEFMYGRATRIYLGYWPHFFVALFLITWLQASRLESVDLLGSFFLVQPSLPKMLLQITWTLTYELYFYLCFAILLLFPRKYLAKGLLAFAVLIILIQAYAILAKDIYAPENFVYASFFYTFFFSPFCLEFLMGCFIGWFFDRYRLKPLKTTFGLTAAMFILTLWYQKAHILPEGLLAQGYFMPERAVLFGFTSALLIMAMIEIEKRGRTLIPKISKAVGGASYSIYLSHIPLLFVLGHSGYIAATQTTPWLRELAVVGIIVMVTIYSLIHYRWIEQPLMRVAKYFRSRIFVR